MYIWLHQIDWMGIKKNVYIIKITSNLVTVTNRIRINTCQLHLHPCRLCPYVIVVVGLDRFSDLWGYASRATHARQTQSEIPDQVGQGVYAVHEGSRFTFGTRLLTRCDCASDPVTAQL